MQCHGSHTCVVITLLTRGALDRMYVAVDTGLSRRVLSIAVFTMWSGSTKTPNTRGGDLALAGSCPVTKSHRRQPRG